MQQTAKESHDPFVLVSVHGLRIDLRKGTITFPERPRCSPLAAVLPGMLHPQ